MSRAAEDLSLGCLIGAGVILVLAAIRSAWHRHRRHRVELDTIKRLRTGARWADLERRQSGGPTA